MRRRSGFVRVLGLVVRKASSCQRWTALFLYKSARPVYKGESINYITIP
ncbi:hypothetical protein DWUX_2236 [Desulfovibrio diazotrophicus]|nr:hypothetical protein DWUX_2236 [Desulfovibrio diazotrophicus]